MLLNFAETIDTLEVLEQRELIRSIVDKLTWDGKQFTLTLFGDSPKKVIPPTAL